MGGTTPSIRALERALALLQRIVADGGRQTVSALAAAAGLPLATAHRIVATLERSGHLVAVSRGRFAAGPALTMLATCARPVDRLAAVARPALTRLARHTGCIAHLGIFEDNMVTYLVKAGADGERLFTREGMQLEAYCSGIGKVLLAHLDPGERERYLAAGPFIALTAATVTDPQMLRTELREVAAAGYAVDDRAVSPDLVCVAVPVPWPVGEVRAAISVSALVASGSAGDRPHLLRVMQATATAIAERMAAAGTPGPGA